jgi:hypothetical protein
MNKKITIISFVILFVFVLIRCITREVLPTKAPRPAKQEVITERYSDPGDNFSVDVPSNWATKETTATERHDIGTLHEVTQQIEIISLYSPERVGVTIQVYGEKPSCDAARKPNGTFAGLPAFYDSYKNLIILATAEKKFFITYSYPGDIHFTQPRPDAQPTTVPESAKQSYKAEIQKIITTFQPKVAEALHCN